VLLREISNQNIFTPHMIDIATIKRILRVLWLVILALSILFYVFYGEYLTADSITKWITHYNHAITLTFCFLWILRGFFLIPGTPFIFAGILLFPGDPMFVYIMSMVCFFFSSVLIYYCSGIGFGDYFEKKYPAKITSLRKKLSKPTAFYFITFVTMLPISPTDLIVYVAGSIKLPFRKVIFPVMIGEGVIVAIYVFNGARLMGYIR
jgi:uncharacterized membrane protein YdjX (TVP38/TMEM64 family)